MEPQNPSIGRDVHYTSHGSAHVNGKQQYPSACRAAKITAINDGTAVSLAVFGPTGLFFDEGVGYSETPRGGTWHWPERV